MIRVAIIEDEKNYSAILKKIIEFDEGMMCCGQFYNGENALKGLKSTNPNVVITDIKLPDMLGYNVVNQLKPEMPKTHFVMCTSFEEDEHIFKALKAGASGYLLKGESMRKIMQSIEDVMDGGAPMSNIIAGQVLQYFRDMNKTVKELDNLSESESSVLEQLAKGMLYKEIAAENHVTIDTIKKQVGSIYRKLHVTNKVEAINKFNQK